MQTTCQTPSGGLPSYLVTLLEGLDTARSLSVAILARYGEWDQISRMKTDPAHYECSEMYWAETLSTDILRKVSDLGGPEFSQARQKQLSKEAVAKFVALEAECFKTNLRLSPYLEGWANPATDERIIRFFRDVRKEVEKMIGRGPSLGESRFAVPSELAISFSEENPRGFFGPGATVSDPSRACTVAHKLASKPSITPNASPLRRFWNETVWAEASAGLHGEPREVGGNIFFTVPKDLTALRGCAKEPSINFFYQRWLGKNMRRGLKSWGIDLESAQDKHRLLAKRASVTGLEATIDLHSASDTVCTTLVKLCLPNKWYEWLTATRSPTTRVEGATYRLEKFSSMGNGFTFELETVLFAAIAKVVCGDEALTGVNFSVYGDDIIVPSSRAQDVIAALKFCGFTPNKRKTYVEGEFRESCGGDFFRGVSVRAHFLEEFPCEPQQYIALANGLRRTALSASEPSLVLRRWSRVRKAWFQVQDELPNHIRRCRGPEELGDLCIHDDPTRWDNSCRTVNSIRYFRVYRPAKHRKVDLSKFPESVQLAVALYGTIQDTPGFITPRDSVLGYAIGWAASS